MGNLRVDMLVVADLLPRSPSRGWALPPDRREKETTAGSRKEELLPQRRQYCLESGPWYFHSVMGSNMA